METRTKRLQEAALEAVQQHDSAQEAHREKERNRARETRSANFRDALRLALRVSPDTEVEEDGQDFFYQEDGLRFRPSGSIGVTSNQYVVLEDYCPECGILYPSHPFSRLLELGAVLKGRAEGQRPEPCGDCQYQMRQEREARWSASDYGKPSAADRLVAALRELLST